MNILSELLFSASVSVDGFAIGCSYGVRNLRSRIFTNVISAVICGLASALAIFFGRVILTFMPQQYASCVGIILLLFLGSYTIISGLMSKNNSVNSSRPRKISIKESLLLALTVSVDAFSAGLGYAMMGHTSLLIPLAVAFFHPLFITLGMGFSGKIIGYFNFSKKILTVLSGSIIIFLVFCRMFIG